MKNGINLNVIVREEKEDGKKIFVVSNDEIGVADFGDSLDEALENFKKSANMYLEAYPNKKEELIKEEKLVLVSRVFL